jgi:hypothetical protein
VVVRCPCIRSHRRPPGLVEVLGKARGLELARLSSRKRLIGVSPRHRASLRWLIVLGRPRAGAAAAWSRPGTTRALLEEPRSEDAAEARLDLGARVERWRPGVGTGRREVADAHSRRGRCVPRARRGYAGLGGRGSRVREAVPTRGNVLEGGIRAFGGWDPAWSRQEARGRSSARRAGASRGRKDSHPIVPFCYGGRHRSSWLPTDALATFHGRRRSPVPRGPARG